VFFDTPQKFNLPEPNRHTRIANILSQRKTARRPAASNHLPAL
jgi:hypothetical protein